MSDCKEELNSMLNNAYEYFDEDSLFDLTDDELVEYRTIVENTLEFAYEHESDISEDISAHSIKKDLEDVLFQIETIFEERSEGC
jgi:hypothetical protein